MTIVSDTSREARRVQLEALRRLGGPQRLEMACRMSDDARAMSEAGIRHRHPDWNDEQVHRALLELMLGADLADAVLDARRPAPQAGAASGGLFVTDAVTNRVAECGPVSART